MNMTAQAVIQHISHTYLYRDMLVAGAWGAVRLNCGSGIRWPYKALGLLIRDNVLITPEAGPH